MRKIPVWLRNKQTKSQRNDVSTERFSTAQCVTPEHKLYKYRTPNKVHISFVCLKCHFSQPGAQQIKSQFTITSDKVAT